MTLSRRFLIRCFAATGVTISIADVKSQAVMEVIAWLASSLSISSFVIVVFTMCIDVAKMFPVVCKPALVCVL